MLHNADPRAAVTDAKITPELLRAALVAKTQITDDQLTQLLGTDRHQISIKGLEDAVTRTGALSHDRLLSLKGMMSGYHTYDGQTPPSTRLPAATAEATGTITLDREPLTVVFVEDHPDNMRAAAQQLGTSQFEPWVCTAAQFARLFTAAYVDGQGDSLRAAKDVYELFDLVVKSKATDLHLTAGKRPMMRVSGELVAMPRQPIGHEWLATEIGRFLDDRSRAELERKQGTDIGYSYGTERFRVNIARDIDGYTLAARQLPSDSLTMSQIGLPPAVQKLVHAERGIILVTGPTGSGKTTTLNAMIQAVLDQTPRHVVTLEDPVEYRLHDGKGLVHQRELGKSLHSFPDGLRDALRQDPDVIFVGELRDAETIRIAVQAAETGHLVFSTTHTFNAAMSLNRILGAYEGTEKQLARQQVAHMLRGIVSQTLCERADRSGVVAAFETLIGTPAVRSQLESESGLNNLRQIMSTGSEHGMQTLERHLVQLVRDNTVTADHARFKARDLDDFDQLMGNR